jgi:hypothetical protein
MIESFTQLLDSVRDVHRDAASHLRDLSSTTAIAAPTLTDPGRLAEWHRDILEKLRIVDRALEKYENRSWFQRAVELPLSRIRPTKVDEQALRGERDELLLQLEKEDLAREVDPDRYVRVARANARQRDTIDGARKSAAESKEKLDKIVKAAMAVENALRQEYLGGIKNSRLFTASYNVGLEGVLEDVRDGNHERALAKLRKLPVRRTVTFGEAAVFQDFAHDVVTEWRTRPEKGIHFVGGDRAVRSVALKDVRRFSSTTPFTSDFDEMEDLLQQPGLVTRDVQALLYWLALKAELATYKRVPTEGIERDFSRGLPDHLCTVAETRAPGLFQALGYEGSFPFEIGYFDIDRTRAETHSGADFAIIVHIGLETGETLTRAALFQVKPAVTNLASVLTRESSVLGRNHQLVAMSGARPFGHYLFCSDPATTVGVTSRSVSSVLKEIKPKRLPGQKIWDLTGKQGKVSTVDDATGFASMIGFRLFSREHEFSSVSDALDIMGRPRGPFERGTGASTSVRMAERLVLFTIGSRISQEDEFKLEGMNFKKRDPADYNPDRSPRM